MYKMLKKNNYSKSSSIYSMLTRVFLYMLFSIMAASCATKVNFKIQRPPMQQVQNIKYIEIGNFEIIPGKIELPGSEKLANSESFSESKKTLQPAVTSFISKKGESKNDSPFKFEMINHLYYDLMSFRHSSRLLRPQYRRIQDEPSSSRILSLHLYVV